MRECWDGARESDSLKDARFISFGPDKNGSLSVTVWLAIKHETERRPFIGKALNKRTIQQLSNYFVPLRRLLSLQCNVTVKLFVVFAKRTLAPSELSSVPTIPTPY